MSDGTTLRPPNGLAFSCRERAGSSLQKANDLAREAVCCNAVFGDPVAIARVATRMRRPHRPGTTPSITGVRSVSRASAITPCTTDVNWYHTQHTITLPITGAL